ncbi:hypothetical protein F0562_018943 [Nyssa sinensis]|uniref:Uncharacterized protein n=1 Tax=Nyssa sinensis TaxID=561372 RepID=A0A5J4ZCI8_9ASTE|nr:hypothetical protein F0562_018943 [Nyssa sinensis]
MDFANAMLGDQQPLPSQMKAESFNATHENFQRRTANYKPNIWKYDLLQSLKTEYAEEKHKSHVEKLKEEVTSMFDEAVDQLVKLELIDNIQKLGLANLFEEQIKEALDTIVSAKNKKSSIEDDLYATALRFRLLRQHNYGVSQDMFRGFMDEMGTFMKHTHDVKAMLELFEASHLALESEEMLDDAKAFSAGILKNMISSNLNDKLAKQLSHAMELPLHWRVQWYDVRRHMRVYENDDKTNSILLELAKINFNMVQATHQKDLRGIARWWRNLGLVENLSFTRDRLVESYLWAVGVAFEPNHNSFRKWLTKAINLVITIDDVYDVYGSLEELECFTNAVDRWDSEEIQQLPECMKICFEALCRTANEVACEVEKEKGWNLVLPHLQKVWADFCKTLLEEAKWYNKGYTPCLQEYLDNGWISSSGPVLSLHAFFSALEPTDEVSGHLSSCQDLVHYTSLIIRLCNDLGTSKAELERGDAPSSILCYMREANVSEEIARKHIRNMITDTWKKINSQCITQSLSLQPFVKYTTNTARVAQFIYQHGDGFGVQDRETRDQVLALLIEPLALNCNRSLV